MWWLAVVFACGCNAVYGLDETAIVNANPRTLLFDNATGATLTDFPLPLFLDATRIDYRAVIDPGVDLRFRDPDTEQDLPFEIEEWDPNGTSVVWVLVPQIDERSATDGIQMFYGADARGTQDARGTWRDYDLVVHGIRDVYQSGSRAVTAAAVGVTSVPGAVGPGHRFGSAGVHRIAYTNTTSMLAGWATFTIELWLYADYASGDNLSGEPHIIDLYPTLNNGRLFNLTGVPQFVQLQIDMQFLSTTIFSPTLLPVRRWSHVLYTFDGQVMWTYRNGALIGLDDIANGSVLTSPTRELVLGGDGNAVEGVLDELRISKTYRDDQWIDAQYRAMRGTFVTFLQPGERL